MEFREFQENLNEELIIEEVTNFLMGDRVDNCIKDNSNWGGFYKFVNRPALSLYNQLNCFGEHAIINVSIVTSAATTILLYAAVKV